MTTTRTSKTPATFTKPTNFSSKTAPFSISTGDFNSDGKTDLVTANAGSTAASLGLNNGLSILLGDGQGKFPTQSSFNLSYFPEFVSAGDFNSDGKIDLIVKNSDKSGVSLLLGDGLGGFGTQTSITVGFDPHSVSVGDFNGDGKMDLVAASYDSKEVAVLLGDGNGGFPTHSTFAVSSNPRSISAGDFNSDGKTDLITANYVSHTVSVLLGDGQGKFPTQSTFDLHSNPEFVSTADFNRDGKIDLVTLSNDGYVVVSLGDGQGAFEIYVGGEYLAQTYDNSLSVGDVDNDGRMDIVTASYYGSVSVLLNTTTNVINSVSTGNITFSGNPQQNQIFSAINNLADADGLGTISYQWSSNGVAIEGATKNSYTPTQIDVGKTLSVMASYIDGHGNLETVTSSIDVAVANSNDLPTGEVTISGNPTQGQVLTAANSLSDLDGLGAIGYQWQMDGKVISGATANTYTLTQDEVGKTISVKANYTDLFSTAESVVSSATVAVANINDLPTGEVAITGTPTQGQVLTANNALVDLDGLGKVSYQWQANGKVISGATANTYVLTQDEVGKTINVKANYTDLFGTAESVVSSATGVVANINDLPIGSPIILGKSIQGETLEISGSLRDEDGMGDFSVQWLSDGKAISGAIQGNYILTQAEVGKTISVQASYIDGQGTTEKVTSSTTTKVTNINDLPTGSVTISGNPTQGQVLTAENTLIDADGLGTLSYQWFANGKVIKDGTDYTYTPTETEIGKALSVKVNYVDGQGTKESVTSNETTLVTNSNHLPTGNIVIKGAAKVEQVLSLTSTLKDADGLGDFSYQWLSNGKEIKNATQDTYKLLKSDIGSKISVSVSYTDGEGTDELVTSVATAKVVTNISAKPSKGNDQLVGTAKNDKLSSLAGDDTLIGGQGADTLTGGKGADTFIFTAESESWITSTTRDTITDFKHSEKDKIDLSAIDANVKITGDQAFKFISTGFSKTDASGQLRFDATSHILYGSTNADSKPEFSIQLNGVNSLVADDFVL